MQNNELIKQFPIIFLQTITCKTNHIHVKHIILIYFQDNSLTWSFSFITLFFLFVTLLLLMTRTFFFSTRRLAASFWSISFFIFIVSRMWRLPVFFFIYTWIFAVFTSSNFCYTFFKLILKKENFKQNLLLLILFYF